MLDMRCMARRDDDRVSERYAEEEQRSQAAQDELLRPREVLGQVLGSAARRGKRRP